MFDAPTHLAYVLLSGLPLDGYRADVWLTTLPNGGTRIVWESRLSNAWDHRLVLGAGGALGSQALVGRPREELNSPLRATLKAIRALAISLESGHYASVRGRYESWVQRPPASCVSPGFFALLGTGRMDVRRMLML